MNALDTTTDAGALGFDPARLQRIDDHFARYVDEGRLAGWQVAVMRNGQLAHHTTYGKRNLETDTDWTPDTIARLHDVLRLAAEAERAVIICALGDPRLVQALGIQQPTVHAWSGDFVMQQAAARALVKKRTG